MRDYYYILGINSNASGQEIKTAYRKLSLKFHPDKNDGEKFFEERFKEIQEAYETLSNSTKKQQYDSKLHQYKSSQRNRDSFRNDEELKRKYEEELKKREEEIKRHYQEREERIKNQAKSKNKDEEFGKEEKKRKRPKRKINKTTIYVLLGIIVGGIIIFFQLSPKSNLKSNNLDLVQNTKNEKTNQNAITTASSKNFKNYYIGVIGFYNVENLFDTINEHNNDGAFLPNGANHYGSEIYFDKLRKLSTVISQIGTDISKDGLSIFGCAETENENVLKDLVEQPNLKQRNYKIVYYDSPDKSRTDVSLLYNPKYFTVKSSELLLVKIFDEDKLSKHNRDILFVYGFYVGEPLYIFVNHWASNEDDEKSPLTDRATAANVCRHKIDSIIQINPDAKIILMGDLNDNPESASLTGTLKAKNEKDNLYRGDMYNPWATYSKNGIGTYAYNDEWSLFDQILLSSAWLSKNKNGFFFKEADIFQKSWMFEDSRDLKNYPKRSFHGTKYNGGYSDHLPVYIAILKEAN